MRIQDGAEYIDLDIGTLDVPTVDTIISELVEKRYTERIPDILLFLSYNPCLAVGARQLDENDFLKPIEFFNQQGIPLYKTVRGGGLTYHWPEQLICYPILKLLPDEQNIPAYMFKLEKVGLKTLAETGVMAHRKRDKTAQIGLWVKDAKIASMGIRISRWITSYGFALNLSGDASPSRFIRPCGLDVDLTTVEEQTGTAPHREEIKETIKIFFNKIFERQQQTGAAYAKEIQDVINNPVDLTGFL